LLMKRLAVSIIAICLLIAGCGTPRPAQSGFNLVFRYGIGAKNELNTFNGTYTKDMVQETSITVGFSLASEETNAIYQKMQEIGFFSYPDRFVVSVPPGAPVGTVTPHPSYYFKVQYGSQVKELWWDDSIRNDDAQASKLRQLIQLIQNIIESKPEYKKLPAPKSGYM
ncbi:MAG: hypothetical protein Q8O16_06335, partial [Dehalococcoidia bacterium]|nr:hypothetical protein [Dehalococcoidia bacterium]